MGLFDAVKVLNSNQNFIFLVSIITIISFPVSIFLFFRGLGVKRFHYIAKWYIFDKEHDKFPNGLEIAQDLINEAPPYYAKEQPKPYHTRSGLYVSQSPVESGFLTAMDLLEEKENGNDILKGIVDERLSMFHRYDNICIAKFAFWNVGQHCLNSEDIVPERPIQIRNKHNKIIATSVMAQEEETNHIRARVIDEHTVELSFDYIDRYEGAVIAIAYVGPSGFDTSDFYFAGKIKGRWTIKEVISSEQYLKRTERNFFHEIRVSSLYNYGMVLFLGVTTAFLLVQIVFGLIAGISDPNNDDFRVLIISIPWFVLSFLSTLSLIGNVRIPSRIWETFNTGTELDILSRIIRLIWEWAKRKFC